MKVFAWAIILGGLAYAIYRYFTGDTAATVDTSNLPGGAGLGDMTHNFVDALQRAITKAEGAKPDINNPGDLTAGDVPAENITGVFNSAGVVMIDTIENGLKAFTNKLLRIMAGQSHVYSPDMTISEFAQKYTGGDNAENWANTVAGELGVTPDTTLAEAQTNFGA